VGANTRPKAAALVIIPALIAITPKVAANVTLIRGLTSIEGKPSGSIE
jgi:hypothetical protein